MPHTVLVVDDRPEIARVLSLLLDVDDRLSLAGVAKDGVEAVAHSQQGCPDAIVCDVEMPRMDGLEALPLLRKACPGAVIIMYSSDTDSADVAPELGADAVVDKAEDPADLIELLVGLCDSQQDGLESRERPCK